MSHEVKRYEWNGSQIETRTTDEREVFVLVDLIGPLGFPSKKGLEKAFGRARKEIGEETWTTPIRGVDGRRRSANVITPLGVHILAMHVENEVGVAFRSWVTETFLRPHLSGARMVTAEQFAALVAERDALKSEAERTHEVMRILGNKDHDIGGGQGRTSREVAEQARISTEGALVLAMTCGVVALIVVMGWVVEVLR